jgi:DNA-binding XRE family transcriptional regulator
MEKQAFAAIKAVNDLTQAQLSQKLGLSRYTIIKAERGQFGHIVRERICQYLGYPVDSPQVQASIAVLRGDPTWRNLFAIALGANDGKSQAG